MHTLSHVYIYAHTHCCMYGTCKTCSECAKVNNYDEISTIKYNIQKDLLSAFNAWHQSEESSIHTPHFHMQCMPTSHAHISTKKGEGGEFYPTRLTLCIAFTWPSLWTPFVIWWFTSFPSSKYATQHENMCVYIPLCITFFIIYRGISVPC